MKVTKEMMEDIKDEYLKNPDKDWNLIAKEHGITRDQVKKIFITCGIYSDSRVETIKEMQAKGVSTKDIAEQLFLSREMVALLTPYDFSGRNVYVTHAIKERKEVFGDKPYKKKANVVLDCLLLKIVSDKAISYSVVPGIMPLNILRGWIAYANGIETDEGYFELEPEDAETLTSGTANIWKKLVGIVFYSPHYEMKMNENKSLAGPYEDIYDDNADVGMQDDPLLKQAYASTNGKSEVSFDGLTTDRVQSLYERNIFRVIETLSVADVIGNIGSKNDKMNSWLLKRENPVAKGVLQGLTNTILFRCGDKTIRIINSTLSKDQDVMSFPKETLNMAVRRCQTECIPVKLDPEMRENNA